MKKAISILFVLIVGSLSAQTENNSSSLFQTECTPNNSIGKGNVRILDNAPFITMSNGAVDTVWQHIEDRSEQKEIITRQFLAASDGSFYFASSRFGGFLTKINNNGGIEWTIDRHFLEDTSKYYTEFKNISELPNGDILVYGSEGKIFPHVFQLYQIYPIRFIISSNGIIKEEKTTRSVLTKGIDNHYVNTIFPDTRIYINAPRRDSLSFFTMDASFTKIESTILLNDDYSDDPFMSIVGGIPYDSTSFIFTFGGTLPFPDTGKSMVLVRLSKEYEILNRMIIHPGGVGKIGIYNDGSFLVVTKDIKRKIHIAKYDNKGKVLWEKQPEILNEFVFENFSVTKAQQGGFLVNGEIYPLQGDGSIKYSSEERHGFVLKLSDDGECEWYYTAGKKGFRNIISSIAEAANGDVVFVCNSLSLFSGDESNTPMQITRLRPKTTGVTEQPSSSSNGILIYPNPTSTTLTISGMAGSTSLRIMNSLGMEVVTQQVMNGKAVIDVTSLSSGMYFASIRTATGIVVKPMVVSK